MSAVEFFPASVFHVLHKKLLKHAKLLLDTTDGATRLTNGLWKLQGRTFSLLIELNSLEILTLGFLKVNTLTK